MIQEVEVAKTSTRQKKVEGACILRAGLWSHYPLCERAASPRLMRSMDPLLMDRNPCQSSDVIISNVFFVEKAGLRICVRVIFGKGRIRVFSNKTAKAGNNTASSMLFPKVSKTAVLKFACRMPFIWQKRTHPSLIAVDENWVTRTTKNDGESRVEIKDGRCRPALLVR